MTEVLTAAHLNRALLARQQLLERAPVPALDVVDRLVGLQAQNTWSPYVAAWSRVAGLGHDEIGAALEARTAARIAVMRGTIHLVTAADALLLPALLAPLFRHDLEHNTSHAPGLRTVDLDELADTARTLVEERPLTPAELGRHLARRWPDVAPASLAHGARGTLPLVQVPPRGVWGRSGATTWTTADAWFGRPSPQLDDEAREHELDRLVLRYLAAYGPADATDVQWWSGLPRLRPVLDRLVADGRAVRLRAEPSPGRARVRDLVDLPGAPRPAPDVPAPVRFLPDYDVALLGHADRTRVVDDEVRAALRSRNGVVPGSVLVDGRVAASWRVERSRLVAPGLTPGRGRRELATLVVHPLRPLDARHRREVHDEGERVVRYLHDDAAEHAVRVADQPPQPAVASE